MATAKKKATAKAAPRRKAKAKPTASTLAGEVLGLPPGMRQLDASFAPTWDIDAMPVLHGTWTDVREVELTQGRKVVTRRCAEVKADDGSGTRVTVWESAGLSALFDENPIGRAVFIRFDGYGKAKKGQNAPKLFTVGVAE